MRYALAYHYLTRGPVGDILRDSGSRGAPAPFPFSIPFRIGDSMSVVDD